MAKKARIKTTAVEAATSREEADRLIEQIGIQQREREALQTAMNEELARIKAQYEERAAVPAGVIRELTERVRIYAEANRAELTRDGKFKTVKLASGEIRWRLRPPSVGLTKILDVLQRLKDAGLQRFIRTKEEVDKEAILADRDAVKDVAGIRIQQGEDFVIVPFATELEEVAP